MTFLLISILMHPAAHVSVGGRQFYPVPVCRAAGTVATGGGFHVRHGSTLGCAAGFRPLSRLPR